MSEYYDRNTSNTFDLTIYPMGNIEVNYEQVQINNHAVTVAVVGDLSAGEYEQWFYNHLQMEQSSGTVKKMTQ